MKFDQFSHTELREFRNTSQTENTQLSVLTLIPMPKNLVYKGKKYLNTHWVLSIVHINNNIIRTDPSCLSISIFINHLVATCHLLWRFVTVSDVATLVDSWAGCLRLGYTTFRLETHNSRPWTVMIPNMVICWLLNWVKRPHPWNYMLYKSSSTSTKII